MTKIFEIKKTPDDELVSRVLVRIHQRIDRDFPDAIPASKRFAKTLFAYDEPTRGNGSNDGDGKNLVPPPPLAPAKTPPDPTKNAEEGVRATLPPLPPPIPGSAAIQPLAQEGEPKESPFNSDAENISNIESDLDTSIQALKSPTKLTHKLLLIFLILMGAAIFAVFLVDI